MTRMFAVAAFLILVEPYDASIAGSAGPLETCGTRMDPAQQSYQGHTVPIESVTGANEKRIELLKQGWVQMYPPPRDSD